MKRIKTLVVIVCLTLAILFIIHPLLITLSVSGKLNVRFAVDINNFKELDEYILDSVVISYDKSVKDLKTTSEYVNVIEYNGHKYQIYAYVFDSIDATQLYFDRCTGKMSELSWNYSMSLGLLGSRFIAYYETCCYRIEGYGFNSFVEAVNYFTTELPIGINTLTSQ